MNELCEGCWLPTPRESLGRFRDDNGRTFERLCGSCKVVLTLTPERKAKLERSIAAALKRAQEYDE